MAAKQLAVKRWLWDKTLSEAAILRHMESEGLRSHRWSAEPGKSYAAQNYGFDRVFFVIRGSLTLVFPDGREKITLHPGDRIDLPAGFLHETIIGPLGVVCLEGHRARQSEG